MRGISGGIRIFSVDTANQYRRNQNAKTGYAKVNVLFRACLLHL